MKKEPLKHQAYQIIKENIINCVYAPDTIINEELIREEIGASRTPIRDALSRLEQEGLIRILPKKGIIISSMTAREVNMLYEARNLLEPYAVLHYGNRISPEVYIQYYQMYIDYMEGKISTYSYSNMDDCFHQLFINASENSYFMNLYSTIESQIRRTRVISGRVSSARLHETVREHLAIVKPALKNDWEAASQGMLHHLSMSKDVIFDYILSREVKNLRDGSTGD